MIEFRNQKKLYHMGFVNILLSAFSNVVTEIDSNNVAGLTKHF